MRGFRKMRERARRLWEERFSTEETFRSSPSKKLSLTLIPVKPRFLVIGPYCNPLPPGEYSGSRRCKAVVGVVVVVMGLKKHDILEDDDGNNDESVVSVVVTDPPKKRRFRDNCGGDEGRG